MSKSAHDQWIGVIKALQGGESITIFCAPEAEHRVMPSVAYLARIFPGMIGLRTTVFVPSDCFIVASDEVLDAF